MTLTPHRPLNPVPTLHPSRPLGPPVARVDPSQPHQQSTAVPSARWDEFDALMAAVDLSLSRLEQRLEQMTQRLENCREDLSRLR